MDSVVDKIIEQNSWYIDSLIRLCGFSPGLRSLYLYWKNLPLCARVDCYSDEYFSTLLSSNLTVIYFENKSVKENLIEC